MEIEVIYQNKNLVALNKPAGLLVHGYKGSEAETLTDWLMEKYPEAKNVGDKPEERPGIVHRLDKDTSGVILIPRNQEYFLYLKELFAKRMVKKAYRVVVHGVVKDDWGTIDAPISIKSGSVKRTVHKGKMEKSAITDYRVLERYKDFTYLEVYPKTGRTHQIRVHLASINHPIVADKLYGGKINKPYDNGQMLHAYSVEFDVDDGERLKVVAEPPAYFMGFLEKLEK